MESLFCPVHFISSPLCWPDVRWTWWWVRTYPYKNCYHLHIFAYMVVNYFHIGGIFIVRSIKKHTCCELGLCLLFKQPCHPPFKNQWLCAPPLQVVCFFQYYILGMIFGGPQSLNITYAIVAPDSTEIEKNRISTAVPSNDIKTSEW